METVLIIVLVMSIFGFAIALFLMFELLGLRRTHMLNKTHAETAEKSFVNK